MVIYYLCCSVFFSNASYKKTELSSTLQVIESSVFSRTVVHQPLKQLIQNYGGGGKRYIADQPLPVLADHIEVYVPAKRIAGHIQGGDGG